MGYKQLLARTISECSALESRAFGPRLGFRIFLYHAVGSVLHHDSYGISIDPQLFDRHMAILAQSQGFSIVALGEGLDCTSPLRVAVTFDDGYRDNLSVAAPILLKHKIPFTIFVTSSFLSHNGASVYLSRAELRELASLPGVTIGSHGSTHTPLARCGDVMLWEELHGSRVHLEDLLGRPVWAISYPHGSVDQRVAVAASKAGYSNGLTSRRNINPPHRNPLLLCRTEIVAADSERVFRQKLFGAWDWNRWLERDPERLVQGESVVS